MFSSVEAVTNTRLDAFHMLVRLVPDALFYAIAPAHLRHLCSYIQRP